jgi:PBSX family phage terminase large subunit
MNQHKTIDLQFAPANDKQRAFIESVERFVLYSGAVSAGKSFLGCFKGFILNLIYPGNRGLICRKELSSLKATTLVTLLEKVIPPEMIVHFDRQEMVLTHKTPIPGIYSKIVFSGLDKSADQQYPVKIGSAEYGWVFFDEISEGSLDDFEFLSTRLRYRIPAHYFNLLKQMLNIKMSYEEFCKQQVRQMFGATNPEGPNHHLYKFFFEHPDKKDRLLIQSTPYDNPYNSPEYLALLESTLTGIRRERLLHGKWVQAEGVIYSAFDPQKHLFETDLVTTIHTYKHFIGGGDSNFPLPRAGLIAGVRGDGTVDILDEFYREGSHTIEIGEWFSQFAQHWQVSITVYHDPSDPEAIETINGLAQVNCEKALNSVNPGISEVSAMFEKGTLRIAKHCTNLIKYLQSYRWKRNGSDEPEKKDDHICDALRYCIFSYRTQYGRSAEAAYVLPEFI